MANPSTLADIKGLVRTQAVIVGSPDFPDALLDRWVNDAQRYIALRLFHLGWKELKGTDSLTLSSGVWGDETTKKAALTSDCPNRMGVPNWLISLETTGVTYDAYAYPISDRLFHEHLTNLFFAPTEKIPICAIKSGDELHLAPSTITAAKAFYYREPTDMATDAATLAIPESFVKHIISSVIMRVDDKKGKLADKQAALVELNNNIAESFKAIKFQEADSVEIKELQ